MAFNVISVLNLDMSYPSAAVVNAVQYDSSGRVVKINLLNRGSPWSVPSNAFAIIRYKKSDRKGGFYDTDENNAYAISYENNRSTINVTLALQMLTTPGNVDVQINFYNSYGERVTVFSFIVKVQKSSVEDNKIVSSDYYNALTSTIKTATQSVNLAEAAPRAEAAAQTAQTAATNATNAANTAKQEVLAQAPTLVSNWMSANISNPSSPPLDRSLSVNGAAAPADVVGALAELVYASNNGYTNANDIQKNCIIFVSSTGGVPTVTNTPMIPCWLETIVTNANLILQICYPYNANNGEVPMFRVKKSGTWTTWLLFSGAQVDMSAYNQIFIANNGYTNADNINMNCTLFVGSSNGVPTVSNTPIFPCWLETVITTSNIALQICHPYNASEASDTLQVPYFRVKRGGTWTNWIRYGKNNGESIYENNHGYADADNIVENCIIFVSSSNGQPNVINVPYFPAWLETIVTHENLILQIQYSYRTDQYPMYRLKQLGVWSDWLYFGNVSSTVINNYYATNNYTGSVSPRITTDTNGWLQAVDTDTASESGKTDMTSSIMAMLNQTGYCHLGPGIFYVSGNIVMPNNSTLEGCGEKTIVRLLGSVSPGYCVRLTQNCTVKNIRFSGGYSDGDISNENIGGRNGVNYVANRDGQEPSLPNVTPCVIDGCWFENFDGSGIYGHNSGGAPNESMLVTNCHIRRCKVGINIDYYSEYHKFTNVVIYQCYFACINNGGNNVFTACTFHGVIGFRMRNSRNMSHGSCIGCTFNHINNMNHPETAGGGLAIDADSVNVPFIFTGCQIWYGKIQLIRCAGFAFSDCLIGGNTPEIKVTGDYPAFFSDCIFNQAPSLEVNSVTKFINCFKYDTGAQIVS